MSIYKVREATEATYIEYRDEYGRLTRMSAIPCDDGRVILSVDTGTASFQFAIPADVAEAYASAIEARAVQVEA